jgi:hypothetical protein
MANKVKLTTTLSIIATGSTAAISGTESKDQVGTNYQESTQTIGTDAEELDMGADIGTVGWLFIKNLSTTSAVQLAADQGMTQITDTVKAGQHLIKLNPGSQLFVRAATAPAQIILLAIEA